MRYKILLLITLLVLLPFLLFSTGLVKTESVTVFRDKTVIGNLNLSGKSWNRGYSELKAYLEKPIYINLESKSQATSLSNIGISVDRDKLAKLTKTCRIRSIKFLCQNTSNEKTDPLDAIKIVNPTLTVFLENLESEVQYLAKNTIISFEDYSFRIPSPNARITLNKSRFTNKKELVKLIGSEERIVINLKLQTQDNIYTQNDQTKTLINKMSYPLLIKYGGNPIYIPAEKIESFIKTESREGYLWGVISDLEISNYLSELKGKYGSENIKVIHNDATIAIQRALLYRSTNYQINNAVILPLEGNPKTNGELHDVYLELVKSQQRLHRFENGDLVKTYVISTGLTWDTPAGVYSVLGKQKMTISYFGNWYMPYYLPIGTIGGYRFGFHEIPYHIDASGNIYSRDPNTMGSPATGGCIQLRRDDAIELYNWAKVGIPVYIYE